MKTKSEYSEFYMLLHKMGLKSSDRRDFISDFSNGAFLSVREIHKKAPNLYFDMLRVMQMEANKNETIKDKWRKRVFGSVGGYLKLMGKHSNAEIIKGIACRSTGYDRFNDIPVERLRNVYNIFLAKQEDFKGANIAIVEHINKTACLN